MHDTMKAEWLYAVILVFCYVVVFSHCKHIKHKPPKSACATEVLAYVHNQKTTSDIVYPCENHVSRCATAEQSISEVSPLSMLSKDGHRRNCSDLGFSINQLEDDLFALTLNPSREYGDMKELKAFFTYTYSCRGSRPSQKPGRGRRAPVSNKQNLTVTIKLLTIALNIKSVQVDDNGTANTNHTDSMKYNETEHGANNTKTEVQQNSTVRLTCVTNLNDSSQYWVFFKGGRTEVWCSPSTSPDKVCHDHLNNVTTDRNKTNFDCSMEIPSAQHADSSEYLCGLATTTDSNEYRSYLSQPKAFTVSQQPPGPEGNGVNLGAGDIAGIVIAGFIVIVFPSIGVTVLAIRKWQVKRNQEPLTDERRPFFQHAGYGALDNTFAIVPMSAEEHNTVGSYPLNFANERSVHGHSPAVLQDQQPPPSSSTSEDDPLQDFGNQNEIQHSTSTTGEASHQPTTKGQNLMTYSDEIEAVGADLREQLSPLEHSFTNPATPRDPNLVCPKCGRQFGEGELRQFQAHIRRHRAEDH